MSIQLDTSYLKGFIDNKEFDRLLPKIKKAHEDLENKKGLGSDFTGWLDLPSRTSDASLKEMEEFGKKVRGNSDCVLSIGIGGSYIGIHSSLEFLITDQKLPVYFAGHNLSSGYLSHLLSQLRNKNPTVVVISKSGTTTEPALAFRIIKKFMQEKYSQQQLKERIVCITDAKKGALRQIANQEGYKTYPIDDDVGGRFSVLTACGLVPLSIAGLDVRGMIDGAREAQKLYSQMNLDKNHA